MDQKNRPEHGDKVLIVTIHGDVFTGRYNAAMFGNTGAVDSRGILIPWSSVGQWELEEKRDG